MTYEEALTARSEAWYTESDTIDQEDWDKVFELYAEDVQSIQIQYNHPVNPPRKRP